MIALVLGSRGPTPDRNSRLPTRRACGYAPTGLGASATVTSSLMPLRSWPCGVVRTDIDVACGDGATVSIHRRDPVLGRPQIQAPGCAADRDVAFGGRRVFVDDVQYQAVGWNGIGTFVGITRFDQTRIVGVAVLAADTVRHAQ